MRIEELIARYRAGERPRRAAARAYDFICARLTDFVGQISKRHRATIEALRLLWIGSRLSLQQWRHRHKIAQLSVIAPARAVGGSVSLEEMQMLWQRFSLLQGEILIDAAPLEAEQIGLLAEAFQHLRVVTNSATALGGAAITVVSTFGDDDDALKSRLGLVSPSSVLRVGTGSRSIYADAIPNLPAAVGFATLGQKLACDKKLHVVLLNDFGFRNQAGYALRRQAMSFLLNGWDVTAVAWVCDGPLREPSIAGVDHVDQWRGFRSLFRAYSGSFETMLTADIVHAVRQQKPDLVVAGSIDKVPYPPAVLPHIESLGIPVVIFDHETASAPGIGEAGIPSPNSDAVASLHPPLLGLDHALFAPIPRQIARCLLGIADTRPLVVMGAVAPTDPDTESTIFRQVHKALISRRDVGVILFGEASKELWSVRSFGEVPQNLMPFILGAADIFVSTTTAAEPGETMLEASSCGLPVVAPGRSQVEFVIDGETGILTGASSAASLLQAIDRLVADPQLRRRMGEAGRRRVEQEFSLARQAQTWRADLKQRFVSQCNL